MLLLDGHNADVTALAFAPDGSRLASAGWDGTVRLWSRYGGEALVLRTGNDHALCLAFSPDGLYLAAGFRSRRPAVLGHGFGNVAYVPLFAQPGRTQIEIRHSDTWFAYPAATSPEALAFCPTDSGLLAIAGAVSESQSKLDCGLYLYRLPERSRVMLCMQSRHIRTAAFCPDGTEIAAISRKSGAGLTIWNTAAAGKTPTQTVDAAFQRPVVGELGVALTYSPDGSTVVGAFASGLLISWVPGAESRRLQSGHAPGAIRSITYSPDGQLLATAGRDGLVKLWETSTWRLLHAFDWKIGDIHCAAFAPDGLTLAAGGNGSIVIWDV